MSKTLRICPVLRKIAFLTVVFVLMLYAHIFLLSQALLFAADQDGLTSDQISGSDARDGVTIGSDFFEVTRTRSGKPLLRLVGRKSQDENQSAGGNSSAGEHKRSAGPAATGRYSYKTLPNIEKETSKFTENSRSWYLIATRNFTVEIEDNEAFGVKTAEVLEGFRLFFIQELMIGEFEMPDGSLSVKIFKGQDHYQAYCDANGINCDQTIGVSHVSSGSYTKRQAKSAQRQILFFWDKDWRKFWDTAQVQTSKRRYYATLFHEATHQLLGAYTRHGGPRWLEEGLAGYFENATFDGKEIFLPQETFNFHGVTAAIFLRQNKNPREVFYWGGRNPASESAYYGLASSFVELLIRTKAYRPYLDQAIAEVKKGAGDSTISESILGIKDEKMWALWDERLKRL